MKEEENEAPECPDSPDGLHEFEVDFEYDDTGNSRSCTWCGEHDWED